MSTALERLEKLDPDIIDHYRRTGESKALPVDLQKRIDWYTSAVTIDKKSPSVDRTATELFKLFPEIKTTYHAKKIYYEALQFFHVDNSVANEVWDDVYAEKFDKLASLCIADNRFEAAGRYLDKAHQLRTTKDSRIKLDDLKSNVFIISNKIKVEDLGFENISLHEIATKHKNGAYIDMIEKLPINYQQKAEIYEDAQIVKDETDE